ncbi:MAG: DUF4065 domain-containing protein [Oscillospiraceae bacterium]|nr:DUF4065 domain-containing protein [Oscillospiraceae bacterium]
MNATAAANYLLYIMSNAFDDLTNMKINKLLYFAQGHYLSKYNQPLFGDSIEAWEHGPVVPAVYSAYKTYGDRPITSYDTSSISDVSPEAEEILYDVARKYGRYTASALRNMTHIVGSPWEQVYQPQHTHIEIPQSIIQEYFSEFDELSPATKQFKESDFIGYRDDDGILVLPKEWDDE